MSRVRAKQCNGSAAAATQACCLLLVSYMPLATNRFWRSQSSPVHNDTYYIHELYLSQASAQQALRACLPESVALRVVFVFPTRTVLLAWTRTDGKYLALTRIEETTLTRQLVGLKFSLAARNGDAATLRALIDAGVDVNKTNGSGSTPVYLAAQTGAADAVELLVKAGADLDAPRNTGATPCLIAAMHGPRPASIKLVRHRLESSLASTQATPRRSRP